MNPESDDGKDGPQPLSAAQEWFIETYGIPFESALELSKMGGEIGKHWLGLLDHLNGELDNEPET